MLETRCRLRELKLAIPIRTFDYKPTTIKPLPINKKIFKRY